MNFVLLKPKYHSGKFFMMHSHKKEMSELLDRRTFSSTTCTCHTLKLGCAVEEHDQALLVYFHTVAQPSSRCTTRHPVAQRVILLHNQNRFLPHSKPLSEREVLLHEAIWPLWRCKKGKHQFYLPLSWTPLGFLFIRRSLYYCKGTWCPVAPPGSFQTLSGSFRPFVA